MYAAHPEMKHVNTTIDIINYYCYIVVIIDVIISRCYDVVTGAPAASNSKSFEVRFQANLGRTAPSTPKADSEMDELLSPRSKRQRPIDEPYTAPRTFLPQRLAGLQSTYHDAVSDDSRDAGSVESGNAPAEELLEMISNFAQSLPEPSRLGQLCASLSRAWTRLLKLPWQLLSCCMKKKVAPSEASFFSKCLYVCFSRDIGVSLTSLPICRILVHQIVYAPG